MFLKLLKGKDSKPPVLSADQISVIGAGVSSMQEKVSPHYKIDVENLLIQPTQIDIILTLKEKNVSTP